MSHDQNFKNLIIDYPHKAAQFFAADEAADVDERVRIIPIREEWLKERLGDRFRELDVPLLVEWPDGRREAVLFVGWGLAITHYAGMQDLTIYPSGAVFGLKRMMSAALA
jgi:hypothetical protein